MTVATAVLIYLLGLQSGVMVVLGARLRRLLGMERYRHSPVSLEG